MDISSQSLLLVEDDPEASQAICLLLKSIGLANVVAVDSARDAVKGVVEASPTVALIDVNFKPTGGFDLVVSIRRHAPELVRRMPILMFSGQTGPAIEARARDAGANAFLAKPFTKHQLKAALGLVMNDQRKFVTEGDYFGPDRRAPSLQEEVCSSSKH